MLRLAWACGQSRQSIATSCGVSKTTVTKTIARAQAAGLSWPLPPLMTKHWKDVSIRWFPTIQFDLFHNPTGPLFTMNWFPVKT